MLDYLLRKDKGKIMDEQENIFNQLTKFFSKIIEIFKNISDEFFKSDMFVNYILLHYKYIIYDEYLINKLKNNKSLLQDKNKLEDFIINYCIQNDCLKLKEVIYCIKLFNNSILNKRILRIEKSFVLLNNDTLDNYLISLIPLLLVQLTGIKDDIEDIIYEKMPKHHNRKEYFGYFIDLNNLQYFAINYELTIKQTIFCGKDKMNDYINNLDNLNFINRNKILHADKEFLDYEYNTKEGLIKIIQYFYFLSLFYKTLIFLKENNTLKYCE